jgi:hypothetical protein
LEKRLGQQSLGPELEYRDRDAEACLWLRENELRVLIDNPSDTLKRRKEKKGHLEIPSKEQFRSLLKELRSGHRSTGEAANLIEFLAYSDIYFNECRACYIQ